MTYVPIALCAHILINVASRLSELIILGKYSVRESKKKLQLEIVIKLTTLLES